MSGGLDSAVAALRLLEAGYEVVGVFVRMWDPLGGHGSRCCSLDDLEDARRVAELLGIPLLERCASREFFDRIFMTSLHRYAEGRTPNPCVLCNREMKLAHLEAVAAEVGAELLATGHYARVVRDDRERSRLLRGLDRGKDQSYFLHRITPGQLERLLLPMGELTKDEVRELARAAGLPVAEKSESQELCFVPRGTSYAELVEGWLPGAVRPGPILDQAGREVGRHPGIHRFTVGQRRGLGISAREPLYVVGLDAEKGVVRVGPAQALGARAITVASPSWLAGTEPGLPLACEAQVRARHRPVHATVDVAGEGRLEVRFAVPVRAPAPGQAAVFYRGDEVLGGGWIEP